MAATSRSNSLYTGSARIPSGKQIAYTAQQIKDEYVARVLSMGGEIINDARVLAACEHLHDNRALGRTMTHVGAELGMIRDGTDVRYLFAIDGQDMEAVSLDGSWPQLSGSGPTSRIRVQVSATAVGHYFRSVGAVIPSRFGSFGMAIAGSDDNTDSTPFFVGLAGGTGSGQTAYLSRLTFQQSAGGRQFRFANPNGSWTPISSSAQEVVIEGNSEFDAFCSYTDMAEGRSHVYRNADPIFTAASPTSISPYLKTLPQKIFIGTLELATRANCSGYFSEVSILSDPTKINGLAAARYLGNYY